MTLPASTGLLLEDSARINLIVRVADHNEVEHGCVGVVVKQSIDIPQTQECFLLPLLNVFGPLLDVVVLSRNDGDVGLDELKHPGQHVVG